jgi:hypothetical protein
MAWIGWAVVALLAIIALLIIGAALDDERRKRALWDEYLHPPDSEVTDFDDN